MFSLCVIKFLCLMYKMIGRNTSVYMALNTSYIRASIIINKLPIQIKSAVFELDHLAIAHYDPGLIPFIWLLAELFISSLSKIEQLFFFIQVFKAMGRMLVQVLCHQVDLVHHSSQMKERSEINLDVCPASRTHCFSIGHKLYNTVSPWMQ